VHDHDPLDATDDRVLGFFVLGQVHGHHAGEAGRSVAVVDELHFEAMATCASASKRPLACGYISQEFSLVRAIFDAPVPRMCPGATRES